MPEGADAGTWPAHRAGPGGVRLHRRGDRGAEGGEGSLSMTAEGTIQLTVADGIARLTFDHERRLNAINSRMWRELAEQLLAVQEDPAARILLIEGAGTRAFC